MRNVLAVLLIALSLGGCCSPSAGPPMILPETPEPPKLLDRPEPLPGDTGYLRVSARDLEELLKTLELWQAWGETVEDRVYKEPGE